MQGNIAVVYASKLKISKKMLKVYALKDSLIAVCVHSLALEMSGSLLECI